MCCPKSAAAKSWAVILRSLASGQTLQGDISALEDAMVLEQ